MNVTFDIYAGEYGGSMNEFEFEAAIAKAENFLDLVVYNMEPMQRPEVQKRYAYCLCEIADMFNRDTHAEQGVKSVTNDKYRVEYKSAQEKALDQRAECALIARSWLPVEMFDLAVISDVQ